MRQAGRQDLGWRTNTAVFGARWCGAALQGFAELAQRAKVSLWHHDPQGFTHVRRRMIWNIRGDFGAEVIGSSGLGYAALR
jgi:hypothetical protein